MELKMFIINFKIIIIIIIIILLLLLLTAICRSFIFKNITFIL